MEERITLPRFKFLYTIEERMHHGEKNVYFKRMNRNSVLTSKTILFKYKEKICIVQKNLNLPT